MKLSLKWLKDYVLFDLPTEKLANRLTLAGLEVEKIEQLQNDIVFELEITPNRPDCLNIIGLAREVSAIVGKSLKYPPVKVSPKIKQKCPITIEDKDGCLRYVGSIVENIVVAPSPKWISERISALGLRTINNVVDITNFCLMEMGQPLHAFDLDKLIGEKIIVRRARSGEKITTIDGVERTLDSSILIIADDKRPVAIAGVMGGKDAEVTSNTKNILLESAYFDPVTVRRAARKLGLSSDSSYRFERGVDFDGVRNTSDRAISLISDLAKGRLVASSDIIIKSKTKEQKTILVDMSHINSYLGANLSVARCGAILGKLGFDVKQNKKGSFKIKTPSHRGDVHISEDVIEEVARITGYDELPMSLPKITVSQMAENKNYKCLNKIRELCLASGLDEAVCYAMVDQKSLNKSNLNDLVGTHIQNPISQEQEMMRPSALPSLLNVLLKNLNQGEKNLKIFEIGKVYKQGKEYYGLSILMTGKALRDWRTTQKLETDFYDLKGIVENVLKNLGIEDFKCYPQQKTYFDESINADLVIQNKCLGEIGRICDDVLMNWDIKIKDVYFGFIDLESLLGLARLQKKFQTISGYPAITRDVSLAVKEDVSYQQLEQLVLRMGGELLGRMTFNEQYLGEKIPAGYRGLVFTLSYQSAERTLREEEVNTLHEKTVQTIIEQFGAIRR
jgi:phenylalanyl-tRNA synthetase beta chain